MSAAEDVAAVEGAAPAPALAAAVVAPSDGASAIFSIAELKAGAPPGVDPRAKERHLSDGDFGTIFGMSKGEFAALKAWKQAELKKKVGLF